MISVLIFNFCQVFTYLFSQIINIGCSFKFILKVDVEESIVNAPLVGLQSQNTNNTKSEVRFKQLIRDPWCDHSSTPTLRINLNEHPIFLFPDKLIFFA
jgi:hypothetical protein